MCAIRGSLDLLAASLAIHNGKKPGADTLSDFREPSVSHRSIDRHRRQKVAS
jgi:hypothetical protein